MPHRSLGRRTRYCVVQFRRKGDFGSGSAPPLEVPAAVPAVRHMLAIVKFLGYDLLSPTDSFSGCLAIARRATAMPDFSRPECKRQYRPTAGDLQRSALVAPHRVCHNVWLVKGVFSIGPDSHQADSVRNRSEISIGTPPLSVELGGPGWRFYLWQTRKRDRRLGQTSSMTGTLAPDSCSQNRAVKVPMSARAVTAAQLQHWPSSLKARSLSS